MLPSDFRLSAEQEFQIASFEMQCDRMSREQLIELACSVNRAYQIQCAWRDAAIREMCKVEFHG